MTELAAKETVICGQNMRWMQVDETIGKVDVQSNALQKGCTVARGIRKKVFDALGFTLSAGVSINKTMAKLATSYGKPDGQAMIHPAAFSEVSYCFVGHTLRQGLV